MDERNQFDLWKLEMDSYSRVSQAAGEILRTVTERKLTMAEFDSAIEFVKHRAILCGGNQP